MEPAGEASTSAPQQLPPVRTSSGSVKVVGFDTSPASVIRFQEDSQTPSPAACRREGSLRRELSRSNLLQPLPKLTINTGRRGLALKKSKSHADLRPMAIPSQQPQQPNTQPSSPVGSSGSGSGPVRIPLELSRARPWPAAEQPVEEDISAALFSAASSLTSHHSPPAGRTTPPTLRSSVSCRELFEAQADAVTAQAQVQGLHAALKREHEEVLRLREELSAVTAERDRLLQEMQNLSAATPRVFDIEGIEPLMAQRPFGAGGALRRR